MFEAASATLTAAGYQHYEVSRDSLGGHHLHHSLLPLGLAAVNVVWWPVEPTDGNPSRTPAPGSVLHALVCCPQLQPMFLRIVLRLGLPQGIYQPPPRQPDICADCLDSKAIATSQVGLDT